MIYSYYRCDWVHPENDFPVQIHYEVDSEGRVPRLIDVFSDGRRMCVSKRDFLGKENEMLGVDSLVEGSFFDGVAGLNENSSDEGNRENLSLHATDAETFELEWQAHRDKP